MFSLEPQFFDIFGAIGFVYIATFALMLLSGKTPPKWMSVILFLVGIIGLIVDASIVYTFFISR